MTRLGLVFFHFFFKVVHLRYQQEAPIPVQIKKRVFFSSVESLNVERIRA